MVGGGAMPEPPALAADDLAAALERFKAYLGAVSAGVKEQYVKTVKRILTSSGKWDGCFCSSPPGKAQVVLCMMP